MRPTHPPGECQSLLCKVLPMLVKQRTLGTTNLLREHALRISRERHEPRPETMMGVQGRTAKNDWERSAGF